MKINEIWGGGTLKGVGQELFKNVAGYNAQMPGRVTPKGYGKSVAPTARSSTPQTVAPIKFSEPVGLPGQEQYVKGPDGWVSAKDQETPAPANLTPILDKALGQTEPAATPATQATPVATPEPTATPAPTTQAVPKTATPAPTTQAVPKTATPAPTTQAVPKTATVTPSRAATREPSLMVQQMRQQAGLPAAAPIPAPATKDTSTMVQQMRQQTAQKTAADKSLPLKGFRPTYGKPATGTPIPLTPAERMVKQPYRNPSQVIQQESIELEESIDLAEVLWQKMKRSQ